MNIAGIIPQLYSQGGAEKYLVRLYEILRKKHDITIYTLAYNKNIFPEIKENIVELGKPFFLKKIHTYEESYLLRALGIKLCDKKISKNHEIFNPHIFPANLIKRKPNVYTCQEPPRIIYDLMRESLNRRSGLRKLIARTYYPFLRAWEKFETQKNTDMIIVNSKNSEEYISKIYKKPIKIIYPGVEENYFKIKNEAENTVLIVGRLNYVKKIDLSIKSFARSNNNDLKLEIVGIGPEEYNLKVLVKQLKLKNVFFRGEITEQELKKTYSRAMMVLYTPIREMFGIVPIEAMAAGVPVIAINEGGPKETIIDGKTGYLVEANVNKIAEKINQLKNSSIRMKMSKQAKNWAKKFTWTNVAKQTIEGFQKFL